MSEFQLIIPRFSNGKTFDIAEVFTGGGKNSYLYGATYRFKMIASDIPIKFFKLYENSLIQNGYVAEEVKQEKGTTRFYKVG